MSTDRSINTDGLVVQLVHGKEDDMTHFDGFTDGGGMTGSLHVLLIGADGAVKEEQFVKNLITDVGDLYIATRSIAAVSPAAPSDATKVTGMKLGTSSTATAKNSTGAALVTYLTASNQVFDATFPSTTNLGAGLGVTAVYQVTWAAGTATSTTLNEVVIVNDAATNATSTAANTISRALFTSTINKGASDVLKVTWSLKQLGV